MIGVINRLGQGSRRSPNSQSLGLATASLILLAGFVGLAHAQTPAIPKKFHNDLRFNLPFQLGDADRAALREVHLYVKHGAENWVCVEKALPTKKAFSFKAPQDGEYWFSIATVDRRMCVTLLGGDTVPGLLQNALGRLEMAGARSDFALISRAA